MAKTEFPMKNTIGIFDSGVGGFSVFKEVRKKLPHHPIMYFADQAHVPYGPRTLEEVLLLSQTITRFLMDLGAELIVIACNAASAAALHRLRENYPHFPFVGMEPAVKPAVEHTHTGVVGVLATPATFQGKLYNSVVERFARNVKIYQNTCPGLVQEIEKGNFVGETTRSILQQALNPMIENNIDTVVLGCTHYPFVIPLIKEIVGPNVSVIDPSPAIANQTLRKVEESSIQENNEIRGGSYLFTSGDSNAFQEFIESINLNHDHQIFQAFWSPDKHDINFIHKSKVDN